MTAAHLYAALGLIREAASALTKGARSPFPQARTDAAMLARAKLREAIRTLGAAC